MLKTNVQFNDRQYAVLKRLASETGKTKAAVLKTALALLDMVLTEQKNGNYFASVSEGKIVREFCIVPRHEK